MLQNGRGASQVLPLQKRGAHKGLLKGGGGGGREVGDHKKFPPFKRGTAKTFTLS